MKEQLEKLVLQMYRSGIRYLEAVREFQGAFIITVLRDQKANQFRAAKKLGMHRNTLRRVIRKLELDIRLLRLTTRRPPLLTVSRNWLPPAVALLGESEVMEAQVDKFRRTRLLPA